MTLDEKIAVMQACKRGEEIEEAYRGYDIWSSISAPSWNFEDRNYRIKPKPKQTVVIEKWLCKTDDDFSFIQIVHTDNIENLCHCCDLTKVKLLETYEIEL